MSLQVKERAFSTARVNPTFAEFMTTSTTFADVTDATGAVIISGNFGTFTASTKKTTNGSTESREIDTGAGTITSPQISEVSLVYVQKQSAKFQNTTAGALTMKLQTKRTSGVTADIQADSYFSINAPLTNLTDLQIKGSVDKIRLMQTTGTGEGLLGQLAPNPPKIDFIEFDVNSIVNAFIFNANSGDLIWDWSGRTLEVIV